MNGTTFFSSTLNRVLGTLALVALVGALAAYAYYTLKQAEYLYSGPTTINVVGEGRVLAVPDIGKFSFSVTTQAPEAGAAQSDAATKSNEIIAYLKEQGIEERDIKVEQYSLTPRYRWEEQRCPFGMACPPGRQVSDGFEVTQTISVKVRDLAKAGTLLSAVGERGATNISGLDFTIDDEEALKAEARASAIADAKAKAKVLADDLNVRIDQMMNFYEESPAYPMPYAMGGEMAMDRAATAAPAPVLPPGENEVVVRVNITYQVK